MSVPRSALVVLLLWSLTALATAFGSSTSANPAAQDYGRYAASGGLRQIIPGHYIYTHKATVTFNSGVIVTSDGVLVLEAQILRRMSGGHKDQQWGADTQ